MPKMHKYTKDPQLLKRDIEAYLSERVQAEKTPHMIGMAIALGIHRQRLHDWIETYSEERWRDKPQAVIPDILKIAKQACEGGLLDQVLHSSKPVGAMFVLKSNYGYIESQHVKHEHSGGVQLVVATGVPSPEGDA